jgi:hypothetical protein
MPMTKEEAHGVARLFIRDYPGALELAYKFRENTTELYGSRASEVPQSMKGGYIPKETTYAGRTYLGRVEVPLENMEDARDLLLTLRHEVLGHYGVNTFTPDEKRALLDGLIAAREEPSLKPVWIDIDQRYAGSSIDMRAEEVFALHCEGVAPSQHVGNDQAQRGQQAFNDTCTAPVRLMQADDLQSIACMVAQGLHDRTRRQQNFPALDTLFRKKKTDMEQKKPFVEQQTAPTESQAATAATVEQNRARHMTALQNKPEFEHHSNDDLSKIAYYRALIAEKEKSSPVQQEAAIARFDAMMKDPKNVKSLPSPEMNHENQEQGKSGMKKRDTEEQSL